MTQGRSSAARAFTGLAGSAMPLPPPQNVAEQLAQVHPDGASGPYEVRHLQPKEFQERPMDSDEISQRDIDEMMAMIDEQGLLQWPIVDSGNRPLAGRRRTYAIQQLIQQRPQRYKELFPAGVPAIAMLDISWDDDPLRADQEMLLIQHTQRRKDSPRIRDQKIRTMAARMQDDPLAKWKGGRTAAGEYHAIKRLAQLFGVHVKVVQRALAEPSPEADEQETLHQTFSRAIDQANKALLDGGAIPPNLAQWHKECEVIKRWLRED